MGNILKSGLAEAVAEICENLYNEGGVSAVTDYANKIGLEYGYCKGCENDMPIIETFNFRHCACCGQPIQNATREELLISNCEFLINQSVEAMKKNIVRVMKSGAIDVDGYDPNNNFMVLPKSIIAALLESEANQFDMTHTSHKKEFLKDKKNVKMFV